MRHSLWMSIRPLLVALAALLAAVPAAHGQPSFSKAFSPDPIGPGSVSTLTFTITNASGSPVTDLAFTDNLPVGVTIATPAAATSTCGAGAPLSAPDGGTTITFSGGTVAANSSCTVSVNVTSATPGTHTNTSGDLTSSAGNSGPASDDLTVDTERPSFTKNFSPNPITVGQTSTLTFTIDNGANDGAADLLQFTDTLPAGLVVADPANAGTTCPNGSSFFGGPGTITANPGESTISVTGDTFLGNFGVAAGSSCTFSVDVIAGIAGPLGNTSGDLTSGSPAVSSGKAGAVLQVNLDPLIKLFTDDPVPPGGTVTLQFTITNFDRDSSATNLAFNDDLGAALAGLAAGPPLPGDPCGAGSTLSGTSVLTLTGGSLGPGESCTFSVTLQVPAAAPGTFLNTTSTLTGEVDGQPVTFNAASDVLVVAPEPVLTKEFTDDPVPAGGTVTLEFTITNTSTSSAADSIAFSDDLSAVLTGLVASALPPSGFCGAGSTISGTSVLMVSAASLAPAGMAGDSCTFQVTLQVPLDAPGGIYLNTTSPVTATVDDETVVGDPASDDLVVVAPPRLSKEFTDDPVPPGATVTLQFTLSHPAEAPGDATGITFTDDLDAALSGLVAIGLPLADPCGAGSQLAGDPDASNLSFTGGSLSPGESCTFAVTLQVPAGAPSGAHTNMTSTVQATVAGVATEGPAASDDLVVAILSLVKSFTNDPVIPGGTVDLQFTIQNLSSSSSATDITFTDNLEAVLAGLVATDLPKADVCGVGSSLAAFDPDGPGPGGTNSGVFLTGGSLGPGESCTFDTVLQVPAGAASDDYGNSTAGFSATVEGETVSFPNAADTLSVNSALLLLSKEFTDDPAIPGGTVTLEFTLTNLDASNAAADIAFSDDLDGALSGLVALGLPLADICGAGSQISGNGVLSFTGGNLAAGASCTFSLTLQVPAGAGAGTFLNTTSSVSGTITGLAVTGAPASDSLRVSVVDLSKAFSGPTTAAATVVLTFTLQNLDATNPVTGLSFTDDLDAVIAGLVALGLPLDDVCGAGSQISGSSVVQLSDGDLGAGGSCTFDVTLQVPASATPGTYPNTTSELLAAGLPVSAPATASLQIEPPPTFAKAFAPGTVGVGQVSTLTFTIDNGASAVAATALDFTDNLPAGVEIATPPNAATTCSGGTLTAVAGGSTIGYSGGSVGAGASCTVQVDVSPTAAGTHVNSSGDLTSSSGNSGPAGATLTAVAGPLFTKEFSPGAVALGETSTITLTIDHSAGATNATNLDLTDDLPAGMVVADPPNASTDCSGGTLTAVAGASSFSYSGGSVAAGAVCTVQVDVTVTGAFGSLVNSVELTSSLGSSGVASATLTVAGSIQEIPTLGQWGLLFFALMLLLMGFFLLRAGGRHPGAASP